MAFLVAEVRNNSREVLPGLISSSFACRGAGKVVVLQVPYAWGPLSIYRNLQCKAVLRSTHDHLDEPAEDAFTSIAAT